MRQRIAVMAVALWLAVIAVGSGITWLVIGQVGRDVSASTASGTDRAIEQRVATATQPAPSPTPTQRARHRPSPAPSVVASPAQTARPHGPATTPRSAAQPPTTAQAVPETTVRRSWFDPSGGVTASCTRGRVALESASPADGWRVEVGDRGPVQVEVTFTGGGDDGSEVQVHAQCSGGAPQFINRGDQ